MYNDPYLPHYPLPGTPVHPSAYPVYQTPCICDHEWKASQQIRIPDPSYPPIDATLFHQSAMKIKPLFEEGAKLSDYIASDKEIAAEIMNAGQTGNQAELDRLVQKAGLKAKVTTKYTPDGIRFEIRDYIGQTNCCVLTMSIRWR